MAVAAERNPSLLAGFLHGVSDKALVEETLQLVAEDLQTVDLVAPLTRMSDPQIAGLKRVIDLCIRGRIPSEQIRQFAYGSVLDKLSAEELVAAFGPLVGQIETAHAHVFEVVSMYVFRSDARWGGCREFIRKLVLLPNFVCGKNSAVDGHHWQAAMIKLLTERQDEELAVEATRQILEAQKHNELRYPQDTYHRPVLGLIFSRYANS